MQNLQVNDAKQEEDSNPVDNRDSPEEIRTGYNNMRKQSEDSQNALLKGDDLKDQPNQIISDAKVGNP